MVRSGIRAQGFGFGVGEPRALAGGGGLVRGFGAAQGWRRGGTPLCAGWCAAVWIYLTLVRD